LSDSGIVTKYVSNGVQADAAGRLSDDDLAKAVSLLVRLRPIVSLRLSDTQVANLEPLLGLTALQRLDLSGTQVANLEPLKGLTALQQLHLLGTQVVNLEPLKGLTALQQLDLEGTQVANLEPLKGLTALELLDVSEPADLEPVYDLPKVKVRAGSERQKAQFFKYRQEKNLPP
jgi:internalin A